MLGRIAEVTEANRSSRPLAWSWSPGLADGSAGGAAAMASVVEQALRTVPCSVVMVPTKTGTTARMISRYKPGVWIVALATDPVVRQGLQFSYGVQPVELSTEPESWNEVAGVWLDLHEIRGKSALLVAGPSAQNPGANHRIEFLSVRG